MTSGVTIVTEDDAGSWKKFKVQFWLEEPGTEMKSHWTTHGDEVGSGLRV